MWGQGSAIKHGEALAAQIIAKKKGIDYVPSSADAKKTRVKKLDHPPNCITSDDSSSFGSVSELSSPGSNPFLVKSPPTCMSNSMAQAFLDAIHKTIDEQKKREDTLNSLIHEQKNLAKARYVNENETGAFLSMKKVKKLQGERNRVSIAMDVALDAVVEIEAEMNRAKSLTILERGANNKSLWFKVEVGEYAKVLKDVQTILQEEAGPLPDKESLLKEVAAL